MVWVKKASIGIFGKCALSSCCGIPSPVHCPLLDHDLPDRLLEGIDALHHDAQQHHPLALYDGPVREGIQGREDGAERAVAEVGLFVCVTRGSTLGFMK